MNQHDAQRAKGAIAVIKAMLRGMEGRDDGLIDVSALDHSRAIAGDWTLADHLTGFLRASGTALSRLALERRSTVTTAAKDVSVTVRRLGVTDALGLRDSGVYQDAARAGTALADVKTRHSTLDPVQLFGDGRRASMAFTILLWGLIVDIAAVHSMSPVDVCDRLSSEMDEVTEH